jgi:Zn-dependent M28 family amino/carboxypeptidase
LTVSWGNSISKGRNDDVSRQCNEETYTRRISAYFKGSLFWKYKLVITVACFNFTIPNHPRQTYEFQIMKRLSSLVILIGVLSAFMIITDACNHDDHFRQAYESINVENLTGYVSTLASDAFLGRKPFSEGEAKTISYLEKKFREIGLEPGINGSYLQAVDMAEISSVIDQPVMIKSPAGELFLKFPDDIAVVSPLIAPLSEISNSELVFAGFGIVAPEYGWDDYKGLDVSGKTVVVFVNDPGLYTGDSLLFKGREMTYYGRWTYKFEEAARHGAAGVLIIHENKGAGYPWDIPRKSALNSNFYLSSTVHDTTQCTFQGWISAPSADSLFNSLGMSVDSLRMAATRVTFQGFSLQAGISLTISNHISYNTSYNVVGKISGYSRPGESIIYTAHWDHFGVGEAENGDSIYNGAVDNGTSLAWMLEIARAFRQLDPGPARTVIFLAPTAEEQGLLGSAWYAAHPEIAMEKTLACINNDMMLPIGRMKDVMITGYGQSDLDALVAEEAVKQDRYVLPDPDPQTGMFFRSDHFSFVKYGVPAVFARGNCDSREHGRKWAAEQERDYIRNRYHRPADNYDPRKWDLSGVAEDARLDFAVGYRLTLANRFPAWSETSEFRNLR